MERYIAKRASLAGLGIGRDLSALSQAAVEKALKASAWPRGSPGFPTGLGSARTCISLVVLMECQHAGPACPWSQLCFGMCTCWEQTHLVNDAVNLGNLPTGISRLLFLLCGHVDG
jgi:hypothetical protein